MRFRTAELGDLSAAVELLLDDPLGSARESLDAELAPEYLDAFRALEADPNQRLLVAEQPLGLPSEPPAVAPARPPPQQSFAF